VTALVSSEESARRLAGKPYPVIVANAADRQELRTRLAGCTNPDVLIHCLSGKEGRNAAAYRVVYYETLRNLMEVLSPKFTVFTGSTSVYPQNDGTLVDENSPVGGTPTGDVLLAAEKLALEAGGGVVRLGGIYGPGRTRFIDSARSGDLSAFGASDAFINFIHRDDAARALCHVGSHRLPGLFNAIDDHPTRRSDLAESIRQNSPLPASPHPAFAGKRVQNSKLRASGWAPQYPSILDALPTL
jgi:nucleoside-diphosphate-sugar epimerase